MLSNAEEGQKSAVTEGLLCANSKQSTFPFLFFLQSTFINTSVGHTTAVHNRDQIPMVSCANQGMTCLSTELSQGQSSSSLYLGHSRSTSCHHSQRWSLLLDPSGCAAWDSQTTRMCPRRVLPRRARGFKAINTEYILGASCGAHAWTHLLILFIHNHYNLIHTETWLQSCYSNIILKSCFRKSCR